MRKAVLNINPEKKLSRIAPELYGNFSEHLGRCIYDGIYVGEDSDIPNTRGMRNDVVRALKDLHLPVLRWPGGCFADEYHWKDGIGPKETRRKIINTNWGGCVEDNSFGTHEFLDLCDQIGCEPYIAVNLGSGTVQEAADWVEYLTAEGESDLAELRKKNGHPDAWKIKYLGIGNENWGGGGSMTPDYYANEYKRYSCFCKEYSGNKLYKIACGPNAEDYHWTRELMSRISHWNAKGISLHYYTLPGDWEHKGSATEYTDEEYYRTISRTLKMEEIIQGHLKIMEECDPDHDIDLVVDEWGTWYDVEPGTEPGFLYQQNTMRDAVVAAINLNIFNKHSDRISMANIAQAVNVLQAVILTEGVRMVKTPTYRVFDMYQRHQGAMLVDSRIDTIFDGIGECVIPSLSESVSVTEDSENGRKQMTVTLSNASLTEEMEIEIRLSGASRFDGEAKVAMLQSDVRAYNTFDDPDRVIPAEHTENWTGQVCTLRLLPCCVCRINCFIR